MNADPLKPPCVKCGRPTGYAAFDGKKIVPCCKRICKPPTTETGGRDGGTRRFIVPGIPQPKGSTRSFAHAKTGRIVTMSDNARLKPWEARVALAAQAAGVRPHGGAVVVSVECVLPRPKGHSGKTGLRASAPTEHTQKPDADKLLRAVLDGLTGIAYADDAQVVTATCRKRWADWPDEPAGAAVVVTQVETGRGK